MSASRDNMGSTSLDRTYRVVVRPRPGEMPADYLLSDILALGIVGVTRVERSELYLLRGDLCDDDIRLLADELLADPIVQDAQWGLANEISAVPPHAILVEVGLLHGVTDTVADNLMARAELLGIDGLQAAATGQQYLLYGEVSADQVHTIARRLLHNGVIQYYQVGQLDPHVGVDPGSAQIRAEVVPLTQLSAGELLEMSRDRLLSLDLAEMGAIRDYFFAQGREPTDAELESLAQTWSEHCVHKTFRGFVEYAEQTPDGEVREEIDSLIKTYLQAATLEIDAPWVRSAFVDNAGIVDFTHEYEVSFKVETHNHPSALEPFGGANTGVGGVIRDIIGVSARPIANTDVLCFGPLDTAIDALPAGVLHPRRIYSGVVSGVEDYGNKMGIPTVNGAIVFEPGYTANPLVYCGCLGIAPVGSHPREAKPGDLVVVLGGRTGRDGLHGATFSSIELTDETEVTSAGAVQIGNPIVEKMTLDAILVARDERLYNAITDCGAGGLSSAVSEMGQDFGVSIQLESVPLKYHGLQPWEIWLSEAQERMVLAVSPKNESRLREICAGYSVEMSVIGTFTGDKCLRLTYDDAVVADLSMAFLHDGMPPWELRAEWVTPNPSEPDEGLPQAGADLADSLLQILRHPNVRSKEDVVRRYDHEVLGGTVVRPFVGLESDGPSDGAVLRPLETLSGDGPESWRGLALGCGFNPAYGEIDPFAMAISAIDEAVRNVVAVGADPARISILDNFCWGNPSLPDRLGGLVRACKGCYQGALHYGTPFISGKDSLNNEYTDSSTGQQTSIPPSLLISALGIVPDVRRTCTMDLKASGDRLYLLGVTKRELGGSYYHRVRGLGGTAVPGLAEAGPATARALHQAISAGLVSACHDCSEGGLAASLAEMAMAGRLGARVSLADVLSDGEPRSDDWLFFSESNGRYIVEVAESVAPAFEECVSAVPHSLIGRTLSEPRLSVEGWAGGTSFSLTIAAIERAWRGHLEGGER